MVQVAPESRLLAAENTAASELHELAVGPDGH